MIGMPFNTFPDLRDVSRLHLRRIQTIREELPRRMGALVSNAIRARTAAGRDAAGRPFAPYSADYARRKRSRGVGGSLLDRLVFRSTGMGRGSVFFSGRHGRLSTGQLAEIHVRGLGKMPRRDFAGWRPDSPEAKELRQELIRQVRRELSLGGGNGLYG